MAKYHEVGRFVLGDSKDEKLIDWESAIFHEEHAAELGELEAMVTMAKLYLGQDREVLVNCVVEVRRSEYRDIGTLNNVYESNYSKSQINVNIDGSVWNHCVPYLGICGLLFPP